MRLSYFISLLFKILCVYLCFSMFFSYLFIFYLCPFLSFFSSQLVVYFVGILLIFIGGCLLRLVD